MSTADGCGGGNCTCGGGTGTARSADLVATINGIALHEAGRRPGDADLRERAWGELLRQEAVRQGLLPRHGDVEAPELSLGDQHTIAAMLDTAAPVAQPTADECRRYYQARQSHFVEGRQVRARHILFAVTAGVDVRKLAARAEQALTELSGAGAAQGRFAQLARELSNCPSGAEGGDLGWFGPDDCADELAHALFERKESSQGVGLLPRLVQSPYGLHIIEILERVPGRQLPLEQSQQRIAAQLAQQSRAKALHQYMQLLAGRALIEGLVLEGADSPLVQ
jgi:peptidyl-prolyl cis-trans isomerase C